MPQPRHSTHRRDSKIILAALIACFLLVSWIAARRLRDIRDQNAALDAGMDPEHWPCEKDAELLCPGLERGGGRIRACLDDHSPDLSRACAQYRDFTEAADDWVLACDAELHSLCAGRVHQLECLKDYKAALSARCAGRIRNYDAATQWRQACSEDAARLCSGDSEDAAKACLSRHMQDLGTSCRVYYLSLAATTPQP